MRHARYTVWVWVSVMAGLMVAAPGVQATPTVADVMDLVYCVAGITECPPGACGAGAVLEASSSSCVPSDVPCTAAGPSPALIPGYNIVDVMDLVYCVVGIVDCPVTPDCGVGTVFDDDTERCVADCGCSLNLWSPSGSAASGLLTLSAPSPVALSLDLVSPAELAGFQISLSTENPVAVLSLTGPSVFDLQVKDEDPSLTPTVLASSISGAIIPAGSTLVELTLDGDPGQVCVTEVNGAVPGTSPDGTWTEEGLGGGCFNNTGDLIADGWVNVTDVLKLVNLIMEGEYDVVGDLNCDGTHTVVDVVLMVEFILSGETYPAVGCTNPAASNYDPAAQVNDGSCE